MLFFCELLMSFFFAIVGGVISSGIWWYMTKTICFPSFEISKKIKDYEYGRKMLEIKNTSKRYGGYNIECYGEYIFSYNGRTIKYPLQPKSLFYLKAGDSEEISVKIPNRVTIDNNISLEDAFYQSSDGVLLIRLVYQNKFGIKRTFTPSMPVQKEPLSYQEQSNE